MPRRYDMGKRAKNTEQTRAVIVLALQRLLARKQYSAITTGDVAREANVSVRTVQRYFCRKDEILAATVAVAERQLAEALSKRPIPGSAGQATRDLVEVRFARFEAHHTNIWPMFSMSTEVVEVLEARIAATKRQAARIDELVARWPDAWAVDRSVASRVIQALTAYPAWRAFTDFNRFPTPEAAKLVADLLCRHLLHRRESSTGQN